MDQITKNTRPAIILKKEAPILLFEGSGAAFAVEPFWHPSN
jgi:hypothetical protein